ncbi:MAG: hypothetical protein IJF11_01290 [Clostridia bacterium]|nr:hypothetical protein [Clostridia bacterium]
MKKILAMLLTLSMLVAILSSCDDTDGSSLKEEEISQQSSSATESNECQEGSKEQENTQEPSYSMENVLDISYPKLIVKEGYYPTLSHSAHAYISQNITYSNEACEVFWSYDEYKASLAPAEAPQVNKDFFENNIVVFIKKGHSSDRPSFCGFKDAKYTYGKLEITVDKIFGTYINPTYVAIPKTIENGLARYNKKDDTTVTIKTEALGTESYSCYIEDTTEAKYYEDDKFWLLIEEEDYESFNAETGLSLDKNSYRGVSTAGKSGELYKIVHYSRNRNLNSYQQFYDNLHMHTDGTVYIDYTRVFFEQRQAPLNYDHQYTIIFLFESEIDFDIHEATGFVGERYDVLINEGEKISTQTDYEPISFYDKIELRDDILLYNPPRAYLDYYEDMFLFKTVEELKTFGVDLDSSYEFAEMDKDKYYYLVTWRNYYNRGYTDIGFANLRFVDGVLTIDLYEALTAPSEEVCEIDLILVPKNEIVEEINTDKVEINHIKNQYYDMLGKHSSKNACYDSNRWSRYEIYADYATFIEENVRGTNKAHDATYINDVTEELFDDNVIIAIKRFYANGGDYSRGYRNASMGQNNTLYLEVDEVYEFGIDTTEAVREFWDYVVIPRQILDNSVVSPEDLHLQLIVNSQNEIWPILDYQQGDEFFNVK